MAHYRIDGEYMLDNMVMVKAQSEETVRRIIDHEFSDGDVLVSTYPRTGTTMMCELTWLLQNDADTDTASATKLLQRTPFLEHCHPYYEGRTGLDVLQTLPRPAVVKTHLPGRMFHRAVTSGRVKVIVSIRNPKDTLVSLYHFYRMNTDLGCFGGSWDDFFKLYQSKHLINGDYFDWYDDWLQYRDRENVKFVRYEDVLNKPRETVEELLNFLGKTLSGEQIDRVVRHTRFSSMKQNKMLNNHGNPRMQASFIRKGEVGDWKNHFSVEQSEIVETTYRERLEQKGIVLSFE